MAGFYFRHFLLHRSQNKVCFSKQGRYLRAMRAKLARNRRVNRRAIQSLKALRITAAERERRNRRIRRKNGTTFAANMLINQLIRDLL